MYKGIPGCRLLPKLPPMQDMWNSPIQRLPSELLRHIFTHCVDPDAWHSKLRDPQSPYHPPIYLLQVSRLWRDIAIDHGYLWSHFSILVYPAVLIPPASVIQTWLDWSSSSLLSLYIDHRQDTPSAPVLIQHLELIVFVVDACIRRCQNLTFAASTSYESFNQPLIHRRVWRAMLKRAASLEALSIRIFALHDYFPSVITAIFESLQPEDLPRLTSFAWEKSFPGISSLSIPSPVYSAIDVTIPCNQLTYLDLSCVADLNSCLRILRSCISLQECFLHFRMVNDLLYSWDKSQIVTMAKLRVFHCSGELPIAALVIDQLVLPALEELRLCGHPSQNAFDGTLLPLLARSSCPLQTLQLLAVNVLNADFLASLALVSSSLQKLEVCYQPQLLPHVVSNLSDTSSSGRRHRLCPGLRSICLAYCFVTADGDVAAMAESRIASATQSMQPLYLEIAIPEDRASHHSVDVARMHALRERATDLGVCGTADENNDLRFVFQVNSKH